MPWPKTGTTHYHAQLGLPAKGRAIKVMIGPWVFGRKRSDLTPLSYPGLLDLTLKCHGQHLHPLR